MKELDTLQNLYCIKSSNLNIHSPKGNYTESFKTPYNDIYEDRIAKYFYDIRNKNMPDYILLEKIDEKYYEYMTGAEIDNLLKTGKDVIHEHPMFISSILHNDLENLRLAIGSYDNIDLNAYVKKLNLFYNTGIVPLKKHNEKINNILKEENNSINASNKTLNKILQYKDNNK